MLKRFMFVWTLAVALTGCNTMQTGFGGEKIWLRSDGQSGKTNPTLAVQFEADKAACTRSGGIDSACMISRDYLLVPEGEVEARAASLRASYVSDDEKCVNDWHTKRGTPEYSQCRTALIQNKGQKDAIAAQSASQRAATEAQQRAAIGQALIDASKPQPRQTLNCTSTGYGNTVRTNCN